MKAYVYLEWLKLKIQKGFWVGFFAIFILTLFFFHYKDLKNHEENSKYFKGALADVSAGSYDKDIERIRIFNKEMELILYPDNSLDDNKAIAAIYEKYREKIEDDGDFIRGNLFATNKLIKRLEYVLGYAEELRLSVDHLKEVAENPILKNSSFVKKSLFSQSRAYEKLSKEDMRLILDKERGIEFLRDSIFLDIVLILFLFYLGSQILLRDREIGIIPLISSKPKALYRSVNGKIGLYFILTLIFSSLVWLSYIMLININIGFGDLNRSLQSMDMFRNLHLNINVGKFIGLFFVYKIFSYMLIVALFMAVFAGFKENKMQFLSIFLILSLSFFAYRFIDKNSYLSIFKYISIFALIDSFGIWQTYCDVALLSIPIARQVFSPIFIFTVTIIFTCIAYVFLSREKNKVDLLKKKKFIEQVGFKSIMGAESYRIFLQGKNLFVIIVILLGGFYYSKTANYIEDGYFRNSYLVNFDRISGGMLTPSRLIAIKDLRKEYENLQISYDELKESYDRGNINRDEYLIKESTILGKLTHFESFKKIERQVYDSLKVTGNDDNTYLIDEEAGNFWFTNKPYRYIYSIYIYIILILSVSYSFMMDKKLNNLIKTTKNGDKRILKGRMVIYFIMTITLFVVVSIFIMYIADKNRMIFQNQALVQSVSNLLNFGPKISFLNMKIILGLYFILSLSLACQILVLLNQILSKYWSLFIGGFVLFILPNLVGLVNEGFSIANYLPFANALTINGILSKLSFMGLIIVLFVNLTFIIILYRINIKLWRKRD